MHTDMALRVHSYSKHPDYIAALMYQRSPGMNQPWYDMTERLLAKSTEGTEFPITISRGYKQIYTCSMTLNNADGLLSPANASSYYNQTPLGAYDPLIDEMRKMRVMHGINCYPSISAGASVTLSNAFTSGTAGQLTDGTYASAVDAYSGGLLDTDAAWCRWQNVPANAVRTITLDLGSSKSVKHGCISFLSRTVATPQIMLPVSVQFSRSVDGVTFTNIGPAFDLSEYTDNRVGQRYLAWFTDCVNSARYVRATITNTSEQNDICLDEFAVWGGSAASSAHLIDAFCGYVGNSVDLYNHDGTIKIQFEDVRKKENDNRQVELTADYRNKRPEQIIWDLLTNPSYWAQSTEVTLGENILLNPSFESGFTNWTLPSHYGYGVVSPAIVTDKVRTGTKSVGMNPNDAQYPGMGSTWTYKQTIACKSNRRYQGRIYYLANAFSDATYQVTVTLTFQSDDGNSLGTATTMVWVKASVLDTWTPVVVDVVSPPDASQVLYAVTVKHVGSRHLGSYIRIDDAMLQEALPTSAGPLDESEIAWAQDDNLSDFTIPRWQGKQGSILDYINELAKLIGWVYDADNSGVRRFYNVPTNQLTADPYLNFFGDRIIGQVQQTQMGKEIINKLKLVGYNSGNREVARTYADQSSIARYGVKFARITEPLIKSADMYGPLAKAILRDYAWARDQVTALVHGDFDIDRPKYLATLHEPIRAFVDKQTLWAIEGFDTELRTDGLGSFKGSLKGRRFVSSIPSPVAGITGAGTSSGLTVSWTANSEVDADHYVVYHSTNPLGPFTASDPVTANNLAVAGTSGTLYWFYVTCVNIEGVESEPSALVACIAGAGHSGSEASTWGITNLAATITDNDPTVDVVFNWTPSLLQNPDYMVIGILGPDTQTPPVPTFSTAQVNPTNNIPISAYAQLQKTNYLEGVTYYWRIAIYDIVIGDRHYKFGSPLLSNIVTTVWP